MIERLLPRQFDNRYPGHVLGLWLFAPLLFVKFMMGFNSIAFTRFVATSADGLHLETATPHSADLALSLYAEVGIAVVMLAILGALALWRYRAMVPLVYLLLLAQQVGGKVLNLAYSSERSGGGSNPVASTFVLAAMAVTLIGLLLSLWRRPEAASLQHDRTTKNAKEARLG